jgi:polysaccharide pyruvyl transferase CsaB
MARSLCDGVPRRDVVPRHEAGVSGALHIGISGSYGGMNLGDEAILESITRQLAPLRPEITVFTQDREDTLARHAVPHAVEIRGLTRDEAREQIRRLDLLVLGGGGILYDGAVEGYLREVAIAHELGVPVVVYAISVGPLKRESNRKLVRECLAAAEVVSVRDRRAFSQLEEIGLEREIVLTADPALLLEPRGFPPEALTREGLEGKEPLVGFSVREPGPAAPDLDANQYHALLADAADFAVDRFGADVVFVPMERSQLDMQHAHAVISRMQFPQRAVVLKGEYGASQVLDLVGRMSFAVGMRLHFLMFAAMQSVPFVALPYAAKVHGFVEDLGLQRAPGERVSPGHLLAHIDRSWDEREKIRQRIRGALPGLRERAQQTHALLLETLARRGTRPHPECA